jgi:hypothetical protein
MKPHKGLSLFKSPSPPEKKLPARAATDDASPEREETKTPRPFSKSRDIRESRSVRQMKTSTQHNHSSNSSHTAQP